jgi:uncharacterized protein
MQPHQERVVIERDELSERLSKLNVFISSAIFNGLSEAERIRLAKQAVVMKDYFDILSERIQAFGS